MFQSYFRNWQSFSSVQGRCSHWVWWQGCRGKLTKFSHFLLRSSLKNFSSTSSKFLSVIRREYDGYRTATSWISSDWVRRPWKVGRRQTALRSTSHGSNIAVACILPRSGRISQLRNWRSAAQRFPSKYVPNRCFGQQEAFLTF
jgi:hypothetical protein